MIPFLIRILLLAIPYLKGFHSQFVYYHSYFFSLDKLSVFLIILTIWIILLMCLSMRNKVKYRRLNINFMFLNLILILCFLRNRLFGFFIFFELSLIPTLIIILGWGVQPERIRAGSYLIIYTLVGSLPLLGALLFMDFHCGSLKIFLLSSEIYFFSKRDYRIFCIFWILAFLIKLPIYGVHLWLPKAHVEAPVAGSMILAGVLLKLGAYGLLRSLHFLNLKFCLWGRYLFVWSVVRICLVGLICFRQCDLKSLVAYSSVAHMSLILSACFSFDIIGVNGVVGLLVSHGLCSSALFFGVQCLYNKRGSRSIYLNNGILNISPLFSFFWFLFCVGKASAPPRLNLLREFFLIFRIVNYGSAFASFFCAGSIFLGGLFSIYLYVLVSHGKWNLLKKYWPPFTFQGRLILFLHLVPLYGLIFLRNHLFFFR
jgi:NADH-ubiquinone oxidoreductase chain 4